MRLNVVANGSLDRSTLLSALMMDCTKCSYFKQKAIRDNVGMIVGLAKGYSQAQELIVTMIEESLRETGSANVKEYLLNSKQ